MHDLFLRVDGVEKLVHHERYNTCMCMGYSTVAAVHQATGQLAAADRCDISPVDDQLLAGMANRSDPLPLKAGLTLTDKTSMRLRQLTRLNIVASEPGQMQTLSVNEALLKSYDLISIQPQSERVLQQACSSLEIDIVTLELWTRLPFLLRPAVLKAAVDRGIHFEILYAPALREQTAKRNFFCNTQALVRALRGKNVIISSGARNAMELRGPYDVINLATMCGLDQAHAKAALSTNCEAVLAKAALRKMYRGAVKLTVADPEAGEVQQGPAVAKQGVKRKAAVA